MTITGSEDTTIKVHSDKNVVLQTYGSHEASVRSFASIVTDEGVTLVLSAGSKMQAHLLEFKNNSLIPKAVFKQKVFT